MAFGPMGRWAAVVGFGACASVASCTIETSSGNGGSGGLGATPSSGGTAGAGGSGGVASNVGGSGGVASNVGGSGQGGSAGSPTALPAALVGNWALANSSGTQTYVIAADGTFTESTLISISTSLDDYFVYETGTVSTTSSTVTFQDATNTLYTKARSQPNFPTTGTSQTLTTATYTWRIQTDSTGTALCLTDAASSETCYQQQ
jgi:hypothetical protein